MNLFPIFVKLAGRRCLVVGAGTVAQAKIRSLRDAGADVRVVAPQGIVEEWAQSGSIRWEKREFQPADLNDAFLVIAATNSSEINGLIFREAEQRNILCNAVDDPEHCDFYYPAVVRRGDLQIAISTAGKSPALAQRLRKDLEAEFGPEYGVWLDELGEARQRLFASAIDPELRKQLLHSLAGRRFPEARKEDAHAR
jgi:precorrin-2 dehydrogenase